MITKIFDYFKTTLVVLGFLCLAIIFNNETYTNVVCAIISIILSLGSLFLIIFNYKLKDYMEAEFPQLLKGYDAFKKASSSAVAKRSSKVIRVLEIFFTVVFIAIFWKLQAIFSLSIYIITAIVCRNVLHNMEKFDKLCKD